MTPINSIPRPKAKPLAAEYPVLIPVKFPGPVHTTIFFRSESFFFLLKTESQLIQILLLMWID